VKKLKKGKRYQYKVSYTLDTTKYVSQTGKKSIKVK
jgi:hypothetical protein